MNLHKIKNKVYVITKQGKLWHSVTKL